MAGIVLSQSPDVQAVFDLGAELARQRCDRSAPHRCSGLTARLPPPSPAFAGGIGCVLLVKADKAAPLQQALADWVGPFKLRGDLRMSIDIDPQSFY